MVSPLSAPTFAARSAGCACHVTSLPGRGPVGDVGPGARRFVDWLGRAGLTWWQILPLHPPDAFQSPYPARSLRAAHTGLISLEDLAADGLLEAHELPRTPARRQVDFAGLRAHRAALRQAFERCRASPDRRRLFEDEDAALEPWIDDWTLFAALSAESGRPWTEWPAELRTREPGALERARERSPDAIEFERFCQRAFQRQWRRLREHAARAGVRLFGDLPMFVAHESLEAWRHPELLGLDFDGRPRWTAGTPPDAFSRDGQNWGVPAWDWDACASEDWALWKARIARELRLVDALRLDHFLGFVRTYRHPTGRVANDRPHYVAGPGRALFEALYEELGPLPFAAEDLGDVTPEARALLAELGFPGMRILQYGFDGSTRDNPHRLHAWPPNSIGTTGTHDNDTWVGWFRKLPGGKHGASPERATRRAVRVTLGAASRDVHGAALRAAAASAANTIVLPIQDLLGLTNRARMNRPGTTRGNWSFRLKPGECTAARADTVAEVLRLTGRA